MSAKTIESQKVFDPTLGSQTLGPKTLGSKTLGSKTLGSKTLTPAEIATVKNTIDLARKGRATLTQLAVAHDLANSAALSGCLGELRAHIRNMVSPTPLHAGPIALTGKDLALGVISGIVTHLILRDV